jgi:hypothetical protein
VGPIARRDVLVAARLLGLGITMNALPSAAAASSMAPPAVPDAVDDGDGEDGGDGDSGGDGGTTYAASAQELLDTGTSASGWYPIRTSRMAAARLVYCNMTDADGGWMLVCYSPDHKATGSRYPNSWSGGEGTLDRLSSDTRQLWFHGATAQCTSVLKMASYTTGRTPLLSQMDVANRVTYGNPDDLTLDASGDGTFTATSTLDLRGTWHAVKGQNAMTDELSVNAPRDWVQRNNYWTVCGPSSELLPNGRSTNGQGTSSETHRSADPLYGMANVNTTTSSLVRDMGTYALFIR